MSDVFKFGRMVPISYEQGLEYGLFRRTPEEEQRWQEQLAAMDARRAVWRKETAEWLAKLDAIIDPLARVVLDLHRRTENHPGEPICVGCDVDGYEAEQPPWPCRTVRLVAEHHGMPAPEWVEFDE